MESQILQHFEDQYTALRGFDGKLKKLDVQILTGFHSNIANVRRFFERYIFPHQPKTALCGINPGRNGAGKTGVPFVDFMFLSKLLGERLGDDEERSAQFFAQVVEHFGAEKFYSHIYVTNLSAFGFSKDGKNINYYELSAEVQDEILRWFATEMRIMNISEIIPCSKAVYTALVVLRKNGSISCNIREPLPHPNWCAFPSKITGALETYFKALNVFIPNLA